MSLERDIQRQLNDGEDVEDFGRWAFGPGYRTVGVSSFADLWAAQHPELRPVETLDKKEIGRLLRQWRERRGSKSNRVAPPVDPAPQEARPAPARVTARPAMPKRRSATFYANLIAIVTLILSAAAVIGAYFQWRP